MQAGGAGGGEPATLAELPRLLARRAPSRVALVEGDTAVDRGELDRLASRVARALLALESAAGGAAVRPGARVAWLARDGVRATAAVLGIAKAGAVSLGMNWRLAPAELAYQLEDSQATVLLVAADFWSALAPEVARLRAAPLVVALEGAIAGAPAWDEWLASARDDDPLVPVDRDDAAVQMYTSGTTGRPKGVMLAHKSFFAVRDALRAAGDPWIGWSERDVSLWNIPGFHIGGLWWAMNSLAAGATNVVLPAFQPARWLEAVERHRVTKVCMVPAMLQMVLSESAASRTDFRSLDHVVYGGAPIPKPLLARALATLGCRFAQIYGLTETGNTAVCLRHEDHDLERETWKAAGKPYAGVRIKIVGPDGAELPARAAGEICIHSPANMLGYWNRPEATAEALRDGWVHTGDGGWLDEDGRVYVHDRLKDMVLYAGENLYPAEIENALASHPAVLEAAVIGIPDEHWGELPIAIVVRRPGATVRARELLDHVRAQLAEFKVPKRIEWSDALPRTPSGKIQKAILRRPYWEGRERQVN